MEGIFKGKRALVTGAGQGIGRAVAIALAKEGAEVYAISRTPEHLTSLTNEMPSIHTMVVDVSQWDLTARVLEHFLPFHLLVNNAGVTSLQAVGEVTETEFDRIFAVNVKAALNISQLVAKDLKARSVIGAIVNVSSQAATVALENHVVYCMSKAALDQCTKVMALELGPSKIRVNSVNPTVVLTEMGKKAWGDESKAAPMKAKIPMGEFCDREKPCFLLPTLATMRIENNQTIMRMHKSVGNEPYLDLLLPNKAEDTLDIKEPEDVVSAVLFLLSDKARMITGACLPIDGGYTVH